MIKYQTKLEPWENYFLQQADVQLGNRSHKNTNLITFHNPDINSNTIYGSSLGGNGELTKITSATPMKCEQKTDEVKVELVSPVESTTSQADSEIQDIIKEGDPAETAILKETARQAATLDNQGGTISQKKKRKLHTDNNVINHSIDTFRDIFAKPKRSKK